MHTTPIDSRIGQLAVAAATLFFVGALDVAASADPLGAGSGAIFRMTSDATFQQGCFPPCLCPLQEEHPVIGTMKVVYAGQINGLHTYSVQDVNWRADDANNPPLHVTGSGVYRIGSPNAVTLMQHRMELELHVGANAAQKFDSGWVALQQNAPIIDILVSMSGQYCFDQVFEVRAARVPVAEVHPYVLDGGSTYQFGCFWFCDCASEQPRPMIGDFDLVELTSNPLFTEYAVVNVQWIALHPDMAVGTVLHGFGFYRRGGEVAQQHQMTLQLIVNDGPRQRFDSGWVIGGGEFPIVDISLEHNPNDCVGTRLHVVGKPRGGICGGFMGIPCEDPTDFCKTPAGHCCCDFLGVCTPTGGTCPAIWDPVCGCDGVTYASECEADAAGVSIEHYGPCGSRCGTPNDPPCPNEMFCHFPTGDCGSSNAGGLCAPIPLACPDVWDPVCGCNDATYGNECEAAAAGMSLAHEGPCQNVCGGIQGIPCPPGEFCRFPQGTCNVSDNQGVCHPVPLACPEHYDPVCGCDGVTYGNQCEADAAGVQVDYAGPCMDPPCPATRTLISANAVYCPGSTTQVRVALNPPVSASAIAMEDMLPAGWTVSSVSNDGFYDPANHAVRWGPFFAPFPAEVSYTIMPANDTAGPKCFAGTISIDGSNDAICGDECLEPCCPRMAADSPQEACDGCPMSGCNFCSNTACGDGRIGLCEVIGYACSWLRGCHDDIGGVTRAAYIWRNGECYCWNEGQGNWFPRPCGLTAPPCCGGSGAAMVDESTAGLALLKAEPIPAGRGQRAGDVHVTIVIKAPPGSIASALELHVPKNWQVISAGEGALDPNHRKVKWGPFLDQPSQTVELVLRPATIRSTEKPGLIREIDGSDLRGTVSFDGQSQPITIGK